MFPALPRPGTWDAGQAPGFQLPAEAFDVGAADGEQRGRPVAGRLVEVMGCFDSFRPGASLGFGQWMPKI